MHTHLMSLYKKITAVIVLFLICFIIFSPTTNALEYDWKNPPKVQIISPSGDGDPWEVERINDPPPDEYYRFSSFISDAKIGITIYLYFRLGWDFNNKRFDDSPINNVYITTLDDCETNCKQTNKNR